MRAPVERRSTADRGSPVALALDVGTSSCRCEVFDLEGRRLVKPGGAKSPYHPSLTPDGGAVLDPETLLGQVEETVDRVLRQKRQRQIVAVGASVFWHSLMGVDEQGRALTPLFLWMDARSRADADQLRQQLDEQAVHARTGCQIHWSYWPAKLLWLRRTNPETARRVRRWVSFGEYLTLHLTGSSTASVSMASGTGLLNQHTCSWDPQMLEAAQIDVSALLPIGSRQVDESAQVRGAYADRWPALRGVPWLPAVGDGACSNLGSGCTRPEHLALMVGTSGAERVVWATEAFDVPRGTWCYRVDRKRIVLGGALNDGGSLLTWLRQTLRLPRFHQLDDAVAAIAPDSHGLTLLPFWAGERSPGWTSDARGAILGLRLHTQAAEIVRAAFEGIALRFRAIDDLLRLAVPHNGLVVATGGALLHSPAWLQIMADVLGRPVGASAELEGSSRGAALLALDATGHLATPLESLEPQIERVYEPVLANSALYAQAAARQQDLYDRLVAHASRPHAPS